MTRLTWKFPQLLERERITVAALLRELEGQVGRATLYRWSTEEPRYIDREVLEKVLGALSRMTGKVLSVSDLLEVESRSLGLSASGLPYTGDPDTDEVLDDVELVERIRALERGEAKLVPWGEVKSGQRVKRQGLPVTQRG